MLKDLHQSRALLMFTVKQTQSECFQSMNWRQTCQDAFNKVNVPGNKVQFELLPHWMSSQSPAQ